MAEPEPDDEVAVRRSDLDPSVWVPITLGFGDQSCFLHAGGMRAVKAWAERRYGVTTWRRVDRHEWRGRVE